jgi:hypothetical protein
MEESKYNKLSKTVTNILSSYCHTVGRASKSLALNMKYFVRPRRDIKSLTIDIRLISNFASVNPCKRLDARFEVAIE